MDFWKSLSGMLTVEFTSAIPEKTLDTITSAKIPLYCVVKKSELTYQIRIRRKDYGKLSGILHLQEDHLEIIKKSGLYWIINAAFYRPILLLCFLFFVISSFVLPTRIFFVTVEGNTSIPDRMILSAAEQCGVRFAASRKLVRSEKVKNALLSELPQLQWAGINTSGCTAVISVRERTLKKTPAEENFVSNLIANQDGFILSSTITGGTAHFVPGETVTKGQLLVSGYTDCGICIRAERAEGEIVAQTNRQVSAVMADHYEIPVQSRDVRHNVSLVIGKKRINLWKDSRISDVCCGRMYEEYFVSLPGGFSLPIALCIDRYELFEAQVTVISEADALAQLQQFSEKYLLQQMVAGQIIKAQPQFCASSGLYRLESDYTCIEMIGTEQREGIGEINGKRN